MFYYKLSVYTLYGYWTFYIFNYLNIENIQENLIIISKIKNNLYHVIYN